MSVDPVPEAGLSMADGMDWEAIKQRLLDENVDLALEASKELRERIDIVHTAEFPRMLSALLPAFASVLSHKVHPNADTTSAEHRVRSNLLEVLSRMPNNEVLRPHAPHILAIAMDVLTNDYEDNALLASRITFDLHKNYRLMPQDLVQPYLDFVTSLYRSLPISVQTNFLFPADQNSVSSPPAATPATSKGGDDAIDETDKETPSTQGATASEPTFSVAQTPPATVLSPSQGIPATPPVRLAPKSSSSFRVLTECPLTVMLLFQLHPKYLKSNIQTMITLMIEALGLRAPPLPSSQTVDSSLKRLHSSRSRELVAAQVKTLSFLTQFLKGFASQLKPYEDRIASNVVSLMTSCPHESIGTRRELLHATRHILATDFRKGFFRHVDSLLDERVLLGSHPNQSDQAVLRPLGYSTLADLVHHARSLLSMKQLSRVVYIFSRVVHDSSLKLPLAVQTTAVRLLLNLVDTIFHNKEPNPQPGRDLLARILDTLVRKLGVLKDYIPVVEKTEQARSVETSDLDAAVAWCRSSNASQERMGDGNPSSISSKTEDGNQERMLVDSLSGGDTETDDERSERTLRKIWSLDDTSNVPDTLHDVQTMIRSIVVGLKTVIWCINNYRHQREKEKGREPATVPAGSNEEIASAMQRLTNWERSLIDKYITYALPCFKVFQQVSSRNDGRTSYHSTSESITVASQYRDVLTYFAAAFTVLDSINFRRTIGTRIDLLIDNIIEDHHVMVIPRHLLGSNQKASFVFSGILLSFLVERMEELSTNDSKEYVFLEARVDANYAFESVPKEAIKKAFECIEKSQSVRKKRASVILELFERVLKYLASFPNNETALRPYLRKIVTTCLRSMVERCEGWPDNYCILLRFTFRAISAGKFEESYKELLPLLPTILNGLYRIMLATNDAYLRHLIVELCLTVPARLSSLLPHMSLLLRMIIAALRSNTGDMVNLGLRTLEFWIDNLNPDFLYPILSKQSDFLTELMTALSSHLRPAPYPYGLLTLRLLGKLGGKNRCFLREPLDVSSAMPLSRENLILSIPCSWSSDDASDQLAHDDKSEKMTIDSSGIDSLMKRTHATDDEHRVTLPLERAVEVLQQVALSAWKKEASEKEETTSGDDSHLIKVRWEENHKLGSLVADRIDLSQYCADVTEQTKRDQAEAAFRVIRSALAMILHLPDRSEDICLEPELSKELASESELSDSVDYESDTDFTKSFNNRAVRTEKLKIICKGFMYASAIDPIREEAMALIRGFAFHIFLLVVSLRQHISRIDGFGSRIPGSSGDETTGETEKVDSDEAVESQKEGVQTARIDSNPLGCFLLTGPFLGKADPFVLSEAIAEVLFESSPRNQCVLDLIRSLLQMSRGHSEENATSNEATEVSVTPKLCPSGCDIFFESLIAALCRVSIASPWNSRSGLNEAIFLIMDELGPKWSRRLFEVEVMHVALLGLKTAPIDIPVAAIKAFQFFSQVCAKLYRSPTLSTGTEVNLIRDPVTVIDLEELETDGRKSSSECTPPSEAVVQMLIGELASVKHIVRFSVRYAMKVYIIDTMQSEEVEKLLSDHMSTIKKLVFSRSLRLLPLPEQVGVFDALAFLIYRIPSLVPLSDQHLLAFLSEFLKMSSIADGEMSDSSMSGYFVDKNGFIVSAQEAESIPAATQLSSHTSSIFLRRECAVKSPSDGQYVSIPEELANGIQLRLSGLRLFRAVIRQHANAFFDADSTTPVGNIRPHVISLLFRSLISVPPEAVIAAHLTLRDVLTLSKSSTESTADGKPQSRLPKELLQTCIRPVLLNLRDYTRLTVPLLRGLARLLSLLSSWFNTTLGEKLLEHLQKWTNPERIISRELWAEGEEPTVAAAILDLFALLPQASHFVERLVKVTIQLEVALPAYKPRQMGSPYRQPLARYLNRHCQYAVTFFFQRLRTPVYSELFQDIVKFEDSKPLREYISGRKCSATLLNVCFERPLGIIRSDQASSSKSATDSSQPASSHSVSEILALHGIRIGSTTLKRDSEEILLQDIEVKQKKVYAVQKEVSRAKENLQGKLAGKVVNAESHRVLEEARMKQKAAQASLDKAIKDLKESKQRYTAEITQSMNEGDKEGEGKDTPHPMSLDALELQYQGLQLVQTLVADDKNYICDHSDVVKAFRWLWRSKGRYLRLQHEEYMPPRFHDESTLLASFLVSTASAFPKDVDILYELLRIFLQPTTSDFSFVRNFLTHTVAYKLSTEQKRTLMKRLFSLLAGDGKEETKTLSTQLIGIPIIASSLPLNTAVVQRRPTDVKDSSEAADATEEEEQTILDQDMMANFATNVLFKDGSPACGDQLRIELLRLSTLLLERAQEQLAPYQKEVIKFSWSLLKSDDSNCKNWACVNLCRFISVFETPPKNVLQVYVALLRTYQQEGKDLVRFALSILVPVLTDRLPPDDFQKMIDFTIKIMYEEANSAPQLAHVWYTIVAHINIFYGYRQRFFRHMINSLNRLGLPPNCPIENRTLAVSIVELVLEWDVQSQEKWPRTKSSEDILPAVGGKKRKGASNEYRDASIDGSNKPKMRKNADGEHEPIFVENVGQDALVMDEEMVETIVNFLVRLRILLADSKSEGNFKLLENKTARLFNVFMSRWEHCSIRSLYFDKVVSMCVSETAAHQRSASGMETQAKDDKGKAKGTGRGAKGEKGSLSKADSIPSSGAQSPDDSKTVSSSLLLACLDIFIVLVHLAPRNSFLKRNSDKVTAILAPCFARVRTEDDYKEIQQKLRDFLLPVLANEEQKILDDVAVFRVKVLLETLIIETDGFDAIPPSTPSSEQKGSRDRPVSHQEKKAGGSCLAHFSVAIIEEASESSPSIVETFSSSLLGLAEKLCAKHLQDAASNQRQGNLYPKQGGKTRFRQKRFSPVAGIIESACSPISIPDVIHSAAKTSVGAMETDWSKQIPTIGTALRSLTACLRLLGSSSIPFSFSQNRATLFRILSNILDSSDNVQVIMTAVSIVRKWLLAGTSHGPFTSKEWRSFLSKLASFDFNGLPDIALQPIADMVAGTVIDLHSQYAANKQEPRRLLDELSEDNDISLGRALVACSINANSRIRSLILQLFCDSRTGDEASGCFRERSPLDILWQLAHSDFNGLGSRMWTIVFVEVLLAGCRLRPVTGKDVIEVTTIDRRSGFSESWLPLPRRKTMVEGPGAGVPDHYASFCGAVIGDTSQGRLEDCLTAVSTLAHGDYSLCQNLFESLLPAAWRRLPNDESRSAIMRALESLLSQPYHAQFIRVPRLTHFDAVVPFNGQRIRGINAIRCFLRAILKLRPLPFVYSNILATLGEKYNSWHEVLTLLSYQHEVLSGQSLGDNGEQLDSTILSSIRHGFQQLGETKISITIASKSCVMPETEHAISLDTYDMVKEALDSYSALIDLVETTDETLMVTPTDFEMNLWEERWISLQREMCQLSIVTDYASSSGDPHLLLESAWKSQDWDRVRALFSSLTLLPAIEDGDPLVKMGEILLAINEGKLNEVESLHVQTAQLCLYKWQLLPAVSTGSFAHASLLHMFHRLVELRESGQIMVETSNHSKMKTLPDLKNLLSAWRHRLPNEFESLSDWDDVFLWRFHMFNAITSNFHWSEPGTLAALHDRPWTAIRMGKTARKQNLRDVAMLSLSNITDSTMDVSDAFSKLREQILVYDNPDSETERTGGLNLVNATNLSYFHASQKSEVFRLKARFLESLGGRSKANQAYCHAVQICPSYARTWESWGSLCSSLGRLAERQQEIEASKSGQSESQEETSTASSKKVAQYWAQAMGCFFEAIHCDSSAKTRVHLPKCLWMLSKDGSTSGILCQTLESRGVTLPSWVWLPWIPQLLTSLYRMEGRAVKALLSRLGKTYPQALYFSLRAFYLERRDVERSRGPTPAGGHQQSSSVVFSEELMSLLRRSHAALWSSLEAILEELIVKFKPSFDEELLVYIAGILERAESLADRKSLKPSEKSEEDAVLASISKNISRISAKFFRTPPPESSPSRHDERSKKTAEFKRKYKTMFEADFHLDAAEKTDDSLPERKKLGLSDFLGRLKKWRRLLEYQVSSTPSSLPLIDSSPSLALFASEAPDLWAGSCDPRHVDVPSADRERNIYFDGGNRSTASSSYLAAINAATGAAQAVAKTALSEGNGGDFGGGSAVIEIPGQYFPNRTSLQDSRPCPELHAKLIRFDSTVRIVRRNEQLVRKIGMVGSDGKTHHFSLQWALPYWTRTEERTSQLFYLMDRILRSGILSSRNYLSLQPTAVIPIAQRLRITSEESTRVSLEDVFRLWCENRGINFDAASKCFHDEFHKQLESDRTSDLDDDAKAKAEEVARLRAWTEVRTRVPANLLLEYMHKKLDGPEQLFQFRRHFSEQLSADALIQHSFCVVERNPSRTAFLERNGQVLSTDYRFEYNNHGFLDPRKVPFRMTPNIQSLIGELLLNGRFIPSMGIIAAALKEAQDELDSALRLLLRDDIVAWYTSKSMAKCDAKMQELEKQLIDRVARNVIQVQTKIAECAPQISKGPEENRRKEPVDVKVRNLVKEATDPKRLCMMPSSYQAWL